MNNSLPSSIIVYIMIRNQINNTNLSNKQK